MALDHERHALASGAIVLTRPLDANDIVVVRAFLPMGPLYEDDDEPYRSGMRWRMVVLVDTGNGGCAVVCEDCSPENLYDAARAAAASCRG